MRNWNEWSSDEISFLTCNYESLTNAQLAEHFSGRTWTSIYKRARKLGLRRPKEIEKINRSESKIRENNPAWRGGAAKNKRGYVLVLRRGHHRASKRGYVMEHIAVWEDFHGEKLPDGYCIHHINGIKDDNRPENLQAMPFSDHTALTHTGLKRSESTKNKISEKRYERDKSCFVAGQAR